MWYQLGAGHFLSDSVVHICHPVISIPVHSSISKLISSLVISIPSQAVNTSCLVAKSVCVATTVVSIVILLLASSDNQVPIISVTSTEILLLQSISIPSEAVSFS
jgi:hypothetical protein